MKKSIAKLVRVLVIGVALVGFLVPLPIARAAKDTCFYCECVGSNCRCWRVPCD
jgi:hypothetical protein